MINISQHCFTYLGKKRENGYYGNSGVWQSNSNYLSTYLVGVEREDPYIGYPISGFFPNSEVVNSAMIFNDDVQIKLRYWPNVSDSQGVQSYSGGINVPIVIGAFSKYSLSSFKESDDSKKYGVPIIFWQENY